MVCCRDGSSPWPGHGHVDGVRGAARCVEQDVERFFLLLRLNLRVNQIAFVSVQLAGGLLFVSRVCMFVDSKLQRYPESDVVAIVVEESPESSSYAKEPSWTRQCPRHDQGSCFRRCRLGDITSLPSRQAGQCWEQRHRYGETEREMGRTSSLTHMYMKRALGQRHRPSPP